MCGRYTLTRTGEKEFIERFGETEFGKLKIVPRFNIAPSQSVLAISKSSTKTTCDFLKWGYIQAGQKT